MHVMTKEEFVQAVLKDRALRKRKSDFDYKDFVMKSKDQKTYDYARWNRYRGVKL